MSLTQGLQLPFGIQQVNPVPVDSWSGPYEGSSLQDAIDLANLTIPSEVRFQSMEVRLIVGGESKKFWYKDGVYDIDLVEFLIGPQGATGPQGPQGAQGPSGVAPIKTKGLVYGDSESYFTQTILPYDINIVSDGAESSSFKLPNTTVIGKEVIVDVMGNNCRFYGFNGGLAFETAVNGSGSQIIAAYNDLIKFTSIGGNYWLVEYLPRVYPTLNGKSLVTQSAVYTFTTSNTTSPLSLSALNASYPNSTTIYTFKVFCPNITGGGLVYIKTGVSTWVSQSITTVS